MKVIKNVKSFADFRRWIWHHFYEKLSPEMNYMLLDIDYEGSELTWVYDMYQEFLGSSNEDFLDDEQMLEDMIDDEIINLDDWLKRS